MSSKSDKFVGYPPGGAKRNIFANIISKSKKDIKRQAEEKAEVIPPITIVCNPNDVNEYYRTSERSMRVPSKLIFHNSSGLIKDLKKEWTKLQWGAEAEGGSEGKIRGNPIPPIHKIRFKVGPHILDNDEYIADYFGSNGVLSPEREIIVEVKHWDVNAEQEEADDIEAVEVYLEEQADKNLSNAANNARKKRNNKFKQDSVQMEAMQDKINKQRNEMEDKINKQWDEIISDIKKIKNDEDAIDNLSKTRQPKRIN